MKKHQRNLNLFKNDIKDNKKEFEKAQAALAEFRDKNKNVTSALARIREERLQKATTSSHSMYIPTSHSSLSRHVFR